MRTKKSTDILIPTEVKILAELSAEIKSAIIKTTAIMAMIRNTITMVILNEVYFEFDLRIETKTL